MNSVIIYYKSPRESSDNIAVSIVSHSCINTPDYRHVSIVLCRVRITIDINHYSRVGLIIDYIVGIVLGISTF